MDKRKMIKKNVHAVCMCHPLTVPARISMRVDRVECRIDSPFDCDQIELWIVILRQVLVVLWIFFCVCMRFEYYKDRIDMGIDWGFAYRIYNKTETANIASSDIHNVLSNFFLSTGWSALQKWLVLCMHRCCLQYQLASTSMQCYRYTRASSHQ